MKKNGSGWGQDVESNSQIECNEQFIGEYESPTKSEDIVDTDDMNFAQFSEVN